MENSAHDQHGTNSVIVVRWSKKPGDDPAVRFVLLSIIGLILCLVSMIFMPILRNFGAIALFTVIFPAILTVPAISSQRSYSRGLTKRVNDTIVEVTGNRGDQLSVRQFRQLVRSGEQHALTVDGVPGLKLHVERAPILEKNAAGKWLVVMTAIPPESGTASFDRLLSAAISPR